MNDLDMNSQDDDRVGRLAERAVFDPSSPVLSPGEIDDATDLELAAASLYLAMSNPSHEAMSDSLRSRVMFDARTFFAGNADPSRSPKRSSGMGWAFVTASGWLAAAASLLLAFWAWKPIPEPIPLTMAQRAETLRASVRPITLSATDHPLARGAGGEILWSADRQEGFIELKGLAEVDPRKGAYQLWIFDKDRDARYPVDGGLFGVTDASKTTIVPIRSAVPVKQPTLFAITLEPPGGVVVSDRKRIMLTGTIAPSEPATGAKADR